MYESKVNRERNWRRVSTRVLAGCALLGAASAASATDYYWLGLAGTTWSSGADWQGAIAPPSSIGTVVHFNTTTGLMSQVDQDWTVGTVDFDSGGSFTLSGNGSDTLSVNAGINNYSGVLQTVSVGVSLLSNLTFNAYNGALNLSGPLNLGSTSLTLTGTKQITLSGNVTGTSDSVLTNDGNLSLTGVNSSFGELTTSEESTTNITGPNISFNHAPGAYAMYIDGSIIVNGGSTISAGASGVPIYLQGGMLESGPTTTIDCASLNLTGGLTISGSTLNVGTLTNDNDFEETGSGAVVHAEALLCEGYFKVSSGAVFINIGETRVAQQEQPETFWVSGDDLQIRYAAVPEPAPFLALGIGALAFLRRRKKA